MERTWKEADTVKPSPRKDKSPEGKQQTSGKKTDEAASETSEMDTTETEMPPLLEVSNDDSNNDENGVKKRNSSSRSPPQNSIMDCNFKKSNCHDLEEILWVTNFFIIIVKYDSYYSGSGAQVLLLINFKLH